jgi:NADH:ubiquinone oxidoreductase subunit E
MPRIDSPAVLEQVRKDILSKRDANKPCITVCSGSACLASGSAEVVASLEAQIEAQGLRDKVDIRKTGCHGFCERGPIIEEGCRALALCRP